MDLYKQQRVILVFCEQDNRIYWDFKVLNYHELILFEEEVKKYNEWIHEYLFTGYAPISSYQDSEDAHELIIARNKKYKDVFERPGSRWLYEIRDYYVHFKLIHEDKKSYKKLMSEKLEMEPGTEELRDILSKPFGNEEFYMGYKVLPMTLKLCDRRDYFPY